MTTNAFFQTTPNSSIETLQLIKRCSENYRKNFIRKAKRYQTTLHIVILIVFYSRGRDHFASDRKYAHKI
jgi:hypothetical protein